MEISKFNRQYMKEIKLIFNEFPQHLKIKQSISQVNNNHPIENIQTKTILIMEIEGKYNTIVYYKLI